MKTIPKIIGNRTETGSEIGSSARGVMMAPWYAPCSASSEKIRNQVVWKLIPSLLKKIGIYYWILSVQINQIKFLTVLN